MHKTSCWGFTTYITVKGLYKKKKKLKLRTYVLKMKVD